MIWKNIMCDIPNNNHIIRYAPPIKINDSKVSIDIFALRENENYLSCFWFEFRNNNIYEIKKDMLSRNLRLNPNGLNLSINISKMKDIITIHKNTYNTNLNISVKHISNKNDSYSGIKPNSKDNFMDIRLRRELLHSIVDKFPISKISD
ncbi:MAG: hypothetical protein LBT79_02325 [Elusimicrobiota bacterium]|nr:hypothetical protein [Elusimicrobiota bacterium]